MYPNMHDPHRYPSEGHPVPPGHPEHNSSAPRYPPPPPYGSTPSLARMPTLGRWSTGLCHCFDDPVNCFITCFCPCITFGQTSEIVNKGGKSCASRGLMYGLLLLTGFPCFYSCFYRSKLRGQYDLPEEPCADCLVHFCCLQCSLCQEFRELQNRGYDMSIGWEANLERQKRAGITMAPMTVPPMSR